MKAIEAVGTIDQDRRVVLDEPLPKGVAGRVRLIILFGEDEPSEQEWLRAIAQGDAFDFLNDAKEDVYSLSDGKPFDDAR